MKIKCFIKQLLLVSIVFLITQLTLASILSFLNTPYSEPNNWKRNDSGHYLSISQKGYQYFPCNQKKKLKERYSNPDDMCGNAGWFPGFPYLIKLFSNTKKTAIVTGGMLSKFFYFLTLLMVVLIAKIETISLRNIIFLLLAAFFFGFIYYNAIFPISTILFFSLLSFYFFLNKKIWLSSLCCLIAAFLYPTAWLLACTLAITLFIQGKNKRQKWVKPLIPTLCGLLGISLVFLIMQLEVNDWTAFIQTQSKYGHGLHSPIINIYKMLKGVSYENLTLNNIIQLQSTLVIVGYFLLSYFFFKKRMFHSTLNVLAYSYLSLFLIFSWTIGGNLSMYRAESLLLPSIFLVRDIKLPYMLSLLTILVGTGTIMCYLFFTNVLI